MSADTAARVHYFDKQFLRVDEFRDEQLYQLALRRRHNNTQHTWGILRGLEIENEDGSIVVQPGFAIDGYGRELLLTAKLHVAPETFDDLGTDRLDLWLIYDRQDDESIPEGYGECGVPSSALRAPSPRTRGEGLSAGARRECPSPRDSGERVAEGRVRGAIESISEIPR